MHVNKIMLLWHHGGLTQSNLQYNDQDFLLLIVIAFDEIPTSCDI